MIMQPPNQYRELVTEFGQAIRTPNDNHRYDSIRLSIYQELFFNNINTFISSAFPVTKSLLSNEHWQRTIEQFLTQHRCQSPLFSEISNEFLNYINQCSEHFPKHLIELMHYEWLELKLDGQCDQVKKLAEPKLESIVRVSPVSQLAVYQYPVHLIGPEFEPYEEITHLLIYRNWNEIISFDLLTPASALLYNSLIKSERSLEYHFEKLALQLGTQYNESFMQFAMDQVLQWYQAGSIVGAIFEEEEASHDDLKRC